MAQNQLDKLMAAWQNLQRSVNKSIPNRTDQIWAARNKLIPPGGGPGPKPS